MLDLKFVTENMDKVIENLSKRQGDFSYLKELQVFKMKEKRSSWNVEY